MFELRNTGDSCGLGVFAVKEIPVGTLILREKPLLETDNEEINKEVERLKKIKLKRHDKIKDTNRDVMAKKIVRISFLIEKFNLLSEEDKKVYLSLRDSFNYFHNKDEEGFSLDIEAVQILAQKQMFSFSEEIAAKIWGIFNTNSFENGVYNLLSRVNHSCVPNAEFVWNKELQTQDLRYSVWWYIIFSNIRDKTE